MWSGNCRTRLWTIGSSGVEVWCVCFTRLEKSNKIGAILGDMSRKCAEKALYHSGQVSHEYNMHSFSLNLYIWGISWCFDNVCVTQWIRLNIAVSSKVIFLWWKLSESFPLGFLQLYLVPTLRTKLELLFKLKITRTTFTKTKFLKELFKSMFGIQKWGIQYPTSTFSLKTWSYITVKHPKHKIWFS